jgi:tRNA pseudouridine32 synthase/23S rRNA pseudouridine746 synthase
MPIDQTCSNNQDETLTKGLQKFEWHIKVDEQINGTALSILDAYGNGQNHKNDISLSKAELKQAIYKGALWLTPAKNKKQTQRLRRVKKTLLLGDELHFYFNSEVLSMPVPQATLIKDLIDYSVWYKPYGMLSQGSKWSDHCTISRFVQQNLPNERPAFIVHRLDRAATGLMLIAHSKKAARALSLLFENRTIENNSLAKFYHIVVHGNHSIRPQPEVITSDVDGKNARSTFSCLAYNKAQDKSLVEVKIDSGRKHQIRIHAASVGLPVLGDRLHGRADKNEINNLQLCAVRLSFICPLSGNEQHFELEDDLKPAF